MAFIRLEHFLEQCTKLDGPNPPSIPTPEMAKNIQTELVFLLDNVEEITCDNVSVIKKTMLNDIQKLKKRYRQEWAKYQSNDIQGIH